MINILHVDDDEDIRTITELAISLDADFALVQCASGAEAIERSRSASPDILLLDMMMPGMNGDETWDRMKSEVGLDSVPAVFMSARADREFAKTMLDKGAAGIITKPFDPMTLCSELKSILS